MGNKVANRAKVRDFGMLNLSMRLFTAPEGYLGGCPQEMDNGNLIAGFVSAIFPFVLWPTAAEDHFEHAGLCYTELVLRVKERIRCIQLK